LVKIILFQSKKPGFRHLTMHSFCHRIPHSRARADSAFKMKIGINCGSLLVGSKHQFILF